MQEKAVSGTALTHAESVVSLPAEQAELIERARDYAAGAKAERTRRAYETDWQDFVAWCGGQGFEALPATPAVIGLFLADRAATLKPATLGRRLAAISVRHRQAGHHLDTRHSAIRDVMTGIRRQAAKAGVPQRSGRARLHPPRRAVQGHGGGEARVMNG
jgi:hypothetical protein